jgi:hypothetical protein
VPAALTRFDERSRGIADETESAMNIPSFIIVADRGSVKSFWIEQTPTRGLMPRLLEAFQVSSAPERYQDRFSDQAGAFPNSGSAGQGNSTAERMTLAAELDTRTCREVAEHMEKVLRQHQPETWGFAAPSGIARAVLDHVQPGLKKTLRSSVHRDLVKVGAHELIEQFAEAQPVH